MTRVLQRYRILHLAMNSAPGFTRRDAAIVVGCYELASRIGELEAEGAEFDKVRHQERNRYGDLTHYTVYRLRHAPPELRRLAGG